MALELQPDEVREIYREFLQLQDMHELVRAFDVMQNYLPSLPELFRIVLNRGLNANDVIEILRIINTGQLQYMQRRIQSLTDAVSQMLNLGLTMKGISFENTE